MQCSRCHRDAIVFQPYSGLHLCSHHLIADVEAKAKKIIRAHGWLKPGDHIAVLLSGDKSSSALLFFLKQLTTQRRDIRITAITIAEGTGTDSNTAQVRLTAMRLDTELLVVPLPEESDLIPEKGSGKHRDISSPPMFPASRSIQLDRMAQQHGITKIAWELCLDDAAVVVLENIIRGDGEKLVMSSSCPDALLRICPFISVTSAEVSLYATLCGCGNELAVNPEQGDRLHKDMVTMLDTFTNNHPATKYALLHIGEMLAGSDKGIASLIQTCEGYGKYLQGCCDDSSIYSEVRIG